MEPRSMLENLILYFVYQTKGHITKTQLVKFLYLADLYSVKWTGKQLTSLDWYFYNHGPWHEDIDTALTHLNDRIVLQPSGLSTLIQPKTAPLDLQTLGISQGLHLMLDNIRREWLGGSPEKVGKIDKLLEYVYSTEPMLAVKGKYQPADKVRLDLALERTSLVEELGI